ncbi:5724_t:CDS:2 [Gigaspora margarita]|uniref:5724_t:CDS:1 n=1 Tax=Gigaspora margarita TaxID=4874 RepID=A0ABM8VYM1_GIGMA|nr:5724_t:CDS:2 [Gigaspora margarita]
MEIEEQIVHPRKLSQKENIRRDQPINEQAHLKRPYQALNNRSNSKSSSRIDQVWVSDNLSRDLQVADILNMEMITESDHGTPLINLDLKTLSIDKYNWAQKISKEK